jgi:hypothetical protein
MHVSRRVVNDHLAELKRFTVARDFNPFPDPVPEKTATSFTKYILKYIIYIHIIVYKYTQYIYTYIHTYSQELAIRDATK